MEVRSAIQELSGGRVVGPAGKLDGQPRRCSFCLGNKSGGGNSAMLNFAWSINY